MLIYGLVDIIVQLEIKIKGIKWNIFVLLSVWYNLYFNYNMWVMLVFIVDWMFKQFLLQFRCKIFFLDFVVGNVVL